MKNLIFYAVLVLVIFVLGWKYWTVEQEKMDMRADIGMLQDSLHRQMAIRGSGSGSDVVVTSMDTGTTTTTVVVLDRANSPISGAQVTLYKQGVTTLWAQLETGATSPGGQYVIRTTGLIAGTSNYKVRAKNGTKDDQYYIVQSPTIIPLITFNLLN